MDPHRLSFFADATGAQLVAADPSQWIHRVITDSRKAVEGDLFVALRGDRFDGHDYLSAVHQKGAAAMIATAWRDRAPTGMPLLVVDSPRSSYASIARAYRRQFDIPVVCVAGSNGKTTAKEMMAALLSAGLSTLKSEASFNNDIGLPASLLRLERHHQAAVFEVGTNHPGELAPLVRLAAPRVGVITSIGREHLEFFGDLAGVAAEEGNLAELLPSSSAGGLLVIQSECAFANHVAARASARVVRVGFGPTSQWQAEIRSVSWEGTRFTVHSPVPGWTGEWTLPMPGRHSVSNAVLAMAVAAHLGIDPDLAREALSRFIPAQRRLNVRKVAGVRVIDDTYNANADSVLAALQTLADLPCAGRRVAVLGDMAELGRTTETAHAEVGRAAARLGIDAVFAVGNHAAATATAAGTARSQVFCGVDSALAALVDYTQEGDSLLIKASRSSGLERIAEGLLSALERRAGVDSGGDPVEEAFQSSTGTRRGVPLALV